ncbi:TRAP-type C4-dicarboxylate transport system permease small subunit [Palleronia aestuarii]|uniref:TRAP transporter small permease protein n=1 Tax=Palleronia aestuarii TaxID=568105 RepID=A0A2W7NJ37_9RHOB|nr:TRAP transporter small permease [Palleronia aestuarii]PZX11302.1 TRAP-type C4-dicarboxylate transport system permease small subunit [Palleronia aestuarii]
MKALSRTLERAAVILGVVALAGILALVAGQVGARVFLGRPLPWPEELGRLLFIYLVFIGAVEASVTRGHIAVDLVDTFGLPPRADRILDLGRDLAMLIVLGVITYGAWKMIPVVNTMRLPATGLRMSLMVVPIFAGSALMFVATILGAVAHLRGERRAITSSTGETIEMVE